MSAPITFYLEQAASCARSAEAEALPNRREKFLEAQVAWQALADRAIRIHAESEKREAEKAERLRALDIPQQAAE